MSRAIVIRAVRAFPLLLLFGLAPLSQSQTNAATGASGCDVTPEEYAVYSAVLSNLAKPENKDGGRNKMNPFFLADKTATSFGGFDTRPENAKWGVRSDSTDEP